MDRTHKQFDVLLLTQPVFLRSRFSITRNSLLGRHDHSRQARPRHRLNSIPLESPQQDAPQLHSPATVVTTSQSLPKVVLKHLLTAVMVICAVIVALVLIPDLYARISQSGESAYDQVSDAARRETGAESGVEESPENVPYEPEFNENLPEGAWIHIPRIGVYTQLLPTADPNEALDKGVWLVPDFGRPGDELPVIAAAHRFGWDWWWQTDYWRYNSFYLLTETEPGDRVEILYNQRKWVYEIYAAEEGELISDYDADVILYTCKHLRSPIRHFRYARLLEI